MTVSLALTDDEALVLHDLLASGCLETVVDGVQRQALAAVEAGLERGLGADARAGLAAARAALAAVAGPLPAHPAATARTRRVLAASPAAVWAAITDPVRLAAWWGPQGFANEVAHIDVRPGGRWLFTMIGPDGTRYDNRCTFLALEPGTRLVLRHDCAPVFTLAIELAPVPGGTRLEWTQTFAEAAVAQAVRAIVEPANEQNLDRLAALLRTPAARP